MSSVILEFAVFRKKHFYEWKEGSFRGIMVVFGAVAKCSLISTEKRDMPLLVFLNPLFYEYTFRVSRVKARGSSDPFELAAEFKSTYCTNL